MTMQQCMENLKDDIENCRIEKDTFPMLCFINMANEARRRLRNESVDEETRGRAEEYLSVCRKSGSDSLRMAAEEC